MLGPEPPPTVETRRSDAQEWRVTVRIPRRFGARPTGPLVDVDGRSGQRLRPDCAVGRHPGHGRTAGSLRPVERAHDAADAPVQHVRVDLGRPDVLVAQELATPLRWGGRSGCRRPARACASRSCGGGRAGSPGGRHPLPSPLGGRPSGPRSGPGGGAGRPPSAGRRTAAGPRTRTATPTPWPRSGTSARARPGGSRPPSPPPPRPRTGPARRRGGARAARRSRPGAR